MRLSIKRNETINTNQCSDVGSDCGTGVKHVQDLDSDMTA